MRRYATFPEKSNPERPQAMPLSTGCCQSASILHATSYSVIQKKKLLSEHLCNTSTTCTSSRSTLRTSGATASSSLASFPTHALAAMCVIIVWLLHLFLIQTLLAWLKLPVRGLLFDFADFGAHRRGCVCCSGTSGWRGGWWGRTECFVA